MESTTIFGKQTGDIGTSNPTMPLTSRANIPFSTGTKDFKSELT